MPGSSWVSCSRVPDEEWPEDDGPSAPTSDCYLVCQSPEAHTKPSHVLIFSEYCSLLSAKDRVSLISSLQSFFLRWITWPWTAVDLCETGTHPKLNIWCCLLANCQMKIGKRRRWEKQTDHKRRWKRGVGERGAVKSDRIRFLPLRPECLQKTEQTTQIRGEKGRFVIVL